MEYYVWFLATRTITERKRFLSLSFKNIAKINSETFNETEETFVIHEMGRDGFRYSPVK
jgi:hypothetical protein